MSTNAELRELALRATPGPWRTDYLNPMIVLTDDHHESFVADCEPEEGPDEPDANVGAFNAAYIAFAHPARILELLDEHRSQDHQIGRLERETDALRAKLDIALRALEQIAADRNALDGIYVHASNAQTEFMYAQRRAIEALAQLKEQP